MKTILIAVPCRERHRQMLEQAAAGRCRLQYIDTHTPEAVRAQAMAQASAVIGQPDLDEICHAPALEWVQMSWAGTDRYTNTTGFPSHVTLTNASGAFGGVIAEHVFAGILSLYRRLPQYQNQQQRRVWQDCGTEKTIEGSRVLILGTGDIGTNLARRLRAFGAYVVGLRRNAAHRLPDFHETASMDALEQQLPLADIVIGCVPGSKETTRLLDRSRLSLMKSDAVVVNVGRGSLIDTDALTDRLSQGHLYGAVLDVTDPEPLPPSHPLWSMEQVILTPHVAGVSFGHAPQTEDRIYEICCDNIRRYLSGQPLRHVVSCP